MFDFLAPGPASFHAISSGLGISERVLPALLSFLTSNDLLEVGPAGYANTPAANAFLVKASPTYVGGRALLFSGFYEAIQHLPESLKSGEPWTPAGQHDMFGRFSAADQQWFADGMFANAARGAAILIEQIDFRRFGTLLDVGGNAGGYAIPIARSAPELRVTIIDLPGLEPLAQRRIEEAGLTGRVAFSAGSFFEALPTGYDAVLLSSILHDRDGEDCARILARVHAALEPGGTVIVTEPMLAEDFSGPDHPAASGLTMALLGGQNRTRSQLSAMLASAGFGELWQSELLPQNSVVTGRRIT